nr:unnamed protein product [Callosobruchus analis]
MPELGEQVYCQGEISIPPTFPFLLKQYAKAAIRSQPTDLLNKTSPGVSYSQGFLWDHSRVAKGTATTTEGYHSKCFGIVGWELVYTTKLLFRYYDLTHTMILLCEILTEEPEGGSEMIPLEVFLDLYVFLARIDASKPQTLKNIHFTDSMINLWKEHDEENDKFEDDTSTEKGNNVSGAPSLEKSDNDCQNFQELSEGNTITKPEETSDREQKDKSTDEKNGSDTQEVDITNEDSVASKATQENPELSEENAIPKGNSAMSVKSKTSEEKESAIGDPVQKAEGSLEDQSFEKKETKNHTDVPYEEIHMAAVPGIGPAVPEELIQTVCEYMEKVAASQRGMVMPRNIANYNCPPLEVLDY